MLLIRPLHMLFSSKDCAVVNWVNTIASCVEPVELSFKEMYPKNYIKYITRSSELTWLNFIQPDSIVGTCSYDLNDIFIYNKYILNVVLSDLPKQPITQQNIDLAIANLIQVLTHVGCNSISIPMFNSYNDSISEKNIVDTITNYFYNVSTIDVTIYK